ncbi:ABC transporter permease [Leuconostoc litchii]|nr:energy-coupling factor transporter transmembrane component T [Leuconostoc litchii]GMA69137.1 ABC transporter permease [Leuconostoc litchii]
MNPVVKFLLILVVSLEMTFVLNYQVNLLIIVTTGLYLLFSRLSWQRYLLLVMMPILPALGAWTSFSIYGTRDMAIIMVTRIIAYIFLGAAFSYTTDMILLLDTLEQRFHLSTTFVYGLRGALTFVPRVRQEIKIIRTAALMRGESLSFYSPQLFFKAILVSLRWSTRLAEAMASHGF